MGLAIRARANLDLVGSVLIEGAEGDAALAAVILDVLELREDAGATGHNTRHANQGVQVNVPEISEGVVRNKVSDPDVDVAVNVFIVLKELEHHALCVLVKDLEGFCGSIHQVEGQHGVGVMEVDIADLKTLAVDW